MDAGPTDDLALVAELLAPCQATAAAALRRREPSSASARSRFLMASAVAATATADRGILDKMVGLVGQRRPLRQLRASHASAARAAVPCRVLARGVRARVPWVSA